jgi:hypothetical protein
MVQGSTTHTEPASRSRADGSRPWWKGRIVTRLVPLLIVVAICVYFYERQRPEEPSEKDNSAVKVRKEHLTGAAADEFLAGLAGISGQAFPANIPWEAIRRVAVRREQAIEQIIRNDPTEFIEMSLDRYDREVHGYSCILDKKERVNGKLKPREVVEACFREQPFSVFMDWKQGAGKAQRVLYVQGENDNKMKARPAGFVGRLGVFTRDVDAPDARASGRYLITQFGIKLGTERTLKPMLSAKSRNALHVHYEGVFQVPQTGNRLCYKIVRTPYDPPEDKEGVNELTLYFDVESWLQVGSILKDSEGNLIAEYFFRNIKINPTFKPNQFKPSAL